MSDWESQLIASWFVTNAADLAVTFGVTLCLRFHVEQEKQGFSGGNSQFQSDKTLSPMIANYENWEPIEVKPIYSVFGENHICLVRTLWVYFEMVKTKMIYVFFFIFLN